MLINKYEWNNSNVKWTEDDVQAACVQSLRRIEKHFAINGLHKFSFAGDQNGAKRSLAAGALAKILGMRAGEPDLRFYIAPGRLWLVELKMKSSAINGKKSRGGKVGDDQIVRHRVLESVGHPVTVIWAVTPWDGVGQVLQGLAKRINCDIVDLIQVAFPYGTPDPVKGARI